MRSTAGSGPAWCATSSPSSPGWRSGRSAKPWASPPSCWTGWPKASELATPTDPMGFFQIGSGAQRQPPPRTRPQSLNDLVVEVAIIRPGPIQGNAVHPYIRRKQGREPVTYAHPLLEPVLKDTLGVILYQEQIIEIAMHVAGMRPSAADGFRRAMTRHLNWVEMSSL